MALAVGEGITEETRGRNYAYVTLVEAHLSLSRGPLGKVVDRRAAGGEQHYPQRTVGNHGRAPG